MCGRFYADEAVYTEVEELTGRLDREGLKGGDIYPASQALILRGQTEGKLTQDRAVWGYEGKNKRPLINARSETVRERPTFRRDFSDRRCVIPTGGFYEWDAGREKFFFTGQGRTLYLAGIYTDGQEARFTILTTQANASVRPVHDRMPLIVKRDSIRRWIYDEGWAAALLETVPEALKRERKSGGYEQLSLF